MSRHRPESWLSTIAAFVCFVAVLAVIYVGIYVLMP